MTFPFFECQIHHRAKDFCVFFDGSYKKIIMNMFIIDTNKEDVLEDFPFIQDWIKNSKKFIKTEIDERKIQFYYSYEFFLPKGDKTEIYRKISKMLFDERLEFELDKTRVNLTMKIGHFILSNRLERGSIPKIINKMVVEITKIKMTIESSCNNDINIKNSIPDMDPNIISKEVMESFMENESMEIEEELEIDIILDKITKNGVESLSVEEKEYLDQRSKDI